ncbi:hypothetical protein JKP88DRAFT_347108 [Tribonema minus]|uniref:Uncharacterized protein n=1 Tax=Tribonema minus TaxID=303371 RepID=A0A835YJK5_9STRA|nr:hypothetical protein JKP88DRAFT_347108 [Tribonema minus]
MTAGNKRKAADSVVAADAGDHLTGLGGGSLYAAASLETQHKCVNVLRTASKNAAGWAKEGLSGKDYLTLLAPTSAPNLKGKCDACKLYADAKNAQHNPICNPIYGPINGPVNNLARKLSGKLREDNAKINARSAERRLQASIKLNNDLRAAGISLDPDLNQSQVQVEVDRILQHRLVQGMLEGTTSGYPGIGRYDGPDLNFPSDPDSPTDPKCTFPEPYKSMTRRGGYEQLLVHAGSGADITVKEARGMVKWVKLYSSTNRVNVELVETAVHAALHDLPLGVRLNRARGTGASSYRVSEEGELLLAPFILFLMVFKGEGLYTEHTDIVAWNPKVKARSKI